MLSQPETTEYEFDSFTHSFSRTARELKHREHWQSIAGRVSLERSMVLVSMLKRENAVDVVCATCHGETLRSFQDCTSRAKMSANLIPEASLDC